jgi:hypothetical protein
VKRREPLQLAHLLEDRRLDSIPVPIIDERSEVAGGGAPGGAGVRPRGIEKRIHTRFDKAFLVVIGSELYGDSFAIARNVSAGGILVEMTYAPPMGTVVTVHFQHARDDGELDEIVARAEVKHHHYLNFTGGNDAASARAIGLRFIEFLDPDIRIAADRVH